MPSGSPVGSGTALAPLAGEEHVCASGPFAFAFAEYAIDRATATIAEIPARARQLFGSIDEAAVRRRRDGGWSAIEYLCHLARRLRHLHHPAAPGAGRGRPGPRADAQ